MVFAPCPNFVTSAMQWSSEISSKLETSNDCMCWHFVSVRVQCSHICFLVCRHDSICLASRHSSLSSKPIHSLYRYALCMCWASSQNRNRWERDDAWLFSEFIPLRFCCRCFLVYFFHRFLCILNTCTHDLNRLFSSFSVCRWFFDLVCVKCVCDFIVNGRA